MADLVLGAVVMVLGVVLLIGGSEISFGAGYDRIGPRFFPYAVGTGLILLGALVTLPSLIERIREREAGERRSAEGIAWTPVSLLGAGMVLYVLMLNRAGYVIASAALFWLAARAFRSRKPVRDMVVGLLLSLATYYAFSRGLGLPLPGGILAVIP